MIIHSILDVRGHVELESQEERVLSELERRVASGDSKQYADHLIQAKDLQIQASGDDGYIENALRSIANKILTAGGLAHDEVKLVFYSRNDFGDAFVNAWFTGTTIHTADYGDQGLMCVFGEGQLEIVDGSINMPKYDSVDEFFEKDFYDPLYLEEQIEKSLKSKKGLKGKKAQVNALKNGTVCYLTPGTINRIALPTPGCAHYFNVYPKASGLQ